MSDIEREDSLFVERSAMGSSCGYGASNLVLWTWALCVVTGLVSLANPALGKATDAGCPGDLTNKVTKFETRNLICKQYSFPSSNPYVIWVCSSLLGRDSFQNDKNGALEMCE